MAGPCCKRSLKIFTGRMESLRPTMRTRIGDAASDGNASNGCNVRMSVTRLSKMLHGARMADLVKLQRGTKPAGQRRQWADYDIDLFGFRPESGEPASLSIQAAGRSPPYCNLPSEAAALPRGQCAACRLCRPHWSWRALCPRAAAP